MFQKIILLFTFLLLLYLNTKAQNVGIGNDTPQAKIHITQTAAIDGLRIDHSGTAGRGAEIGLTNAANSETGLFVNHDGTGSSIVAQNVNSNNSSAINVTQSSYNGTDEVDHRGIYGYSSPASNYGIGVLGVGGWYGIYSQGDMTATGTKAFTIDHPADPTNKMLKHFSIESNEVLNLYRGTIELDANGQAIVDLPDYFELINKDYSYQLTAIGTPQQPYVLSEIENNQFVVAGAPNTKVSWTVYADRNDPYIQQYPEKGIDVVEKTGGRKGKYFIPELYNQPAEAGYFYNKDIQNGGAKTAKISEDSPKDKNIRAGHTKDRNAQPSLIDPPAPSRDIQNITPSEGGVEKSNK